MRAMAAIRLALALGLSPLAGCGPSNPVLGDWEVDREETGWGALLAVQATGLEHLSFDASGASAGETKIPGQWVVEEGRVRLVREDGRGEHAVEVVSEDQIRVELPIGVTAVYRRQHG